MCFKDSRRLSMLYIEVAVVQFAQVHLVTHITLTKVHDGALPVMSQFVIELIFSVHVAVNGVVVFPGKTSIIITQCNQQSLAYNLE